MKITCEREKLLPAFQMAAAVAPSRNTPKPILSNVKLTASGNTATLLATDLEIGIRVTVPGVQADVPGEAVLPIGHFQSILRESSDAQLKIEVDGTNIVVRGDRSEFRLPAANPTEFPTIQEFTETRYHEVSGRLFRELIRRTAFATDAESTRYALGGVMLELGDEEIIGVGTDGRRLAKMAGPARRVGDGPGEAPPIVPTKAMTHIERAISDTDSEIRIAARANDVLVSTNRATIYSRLVEGRFPKWRDVFPKRTRSRQIDMVVGPFYAAVRQAAIATDEESRGLDFTFGAGRVVLSARAAKIGQSRVEMPVSYDGEEIGITLDPRFLMDFLKVLEPEKTFTLEVETPETAAVCRTDDGYDYVIMPLARER